MKRTIICVLTALFVLLGSGNIAYAQVEKGNILIDPYVGIPTMNMAWVLDADISGDQITGTIGPPISFGGRLEYMLADNFGLKLDANYRISGFTRDREFYNSTLGVWETGEVRFTSNALRIMIGANYHFVQTANWDIYTGLSVGYKNKIKVQTYNGVSEDPGPEDFLLTALPLSARIAIGGKYYFHPNVGINFEIGALGGSPVQLGVAVKL